MTTYLKHITPEQIRELANLSDGLVAEHREKRKGRPWDFSSSLVSGHDLYSYLDQLLLDNSEAYAEFMVTYWIGRGDASPREFQTLVQQNNRQDHDPTYLVNKAPMRKYLETGLWALGYPSDIDEKWKDEYRMQRWSHGDADHVNDGPKHTQEAPQYTVDMFGSADAPLQYLSLEDAVNCVVMGWSAEGMIEKMSIPQRIELTALFDHGKPETQDNKTWEETLEGAIMWYNVGPNGIDRAWMASQSKPFSEYIVNGLRRLGMLEKAQEVAEALKRKDQSAG